MNRRQLMALSGAASLSTVLPARAQAGQVVAYTAFAESVTALTPGFKAKAGMDIQLVAAGSGELVRRLTAERARPLADAVISVGGESIDSAPALFAKYTLAEDAAITPMLKVSPNWIPFSVTLATVVMVNTRLVPEAEIPTSWAQLADPKWKGKIAFTDPANSGSAYTTVTMLVDLWGGGDAGWKKVGQLFKNLKVLNRSSLVFQGVGNGEYPLGISLEYAGPMWAAGGAPVKTIYPADGTLATMEGVAIIRNGPDPEEARAFVDFVNRKDVREMILKATFRRPTRTDLDLATLPGGLPPIGSLKMLSYNEDAWTDKRK